MKKILNVSVTGHRGDKLTIRDEKYGYNINSEENKILRAMFYDKFKSLFKHYRPKIMNVYVGGALGTDQVAFQAAFEFKQKYGNKLDVKIHLCLPDNKVNPKWNKENKTVHKLQKSLAARVINVNEVKGYVADEFNDIYKRRNQYMVDNGNDILLAVFDGSSYNSGTFSTINYAKKKKVKIYYFPLDYMYDVANFNHNKCFFK